MKTKFVIRIVFSVLVVISLLNSACSVRPGSAGTSTRMHAWLDQPPDGYTLPLASFPLIAHARQPGGGVKQINFTANGTLLGSVNTDQSVDLTEATLDWNPSAPGIYRIQAVSFNNSGEEAYSEISVVCIEGAGGTGCPVIGEVIESPAPGDEGLKVGASPESLKIGAGCSATTASINFEGFVADLTGVIEVDIHGFMISSTDARREFILALRDSGGGGYTGTYTLNSDDLAFFAGGDGKIVYTLSLMNDRKEWFRNSVEKFIIIERCTAPGGTVIKVGGVPNPVYIGKCTRGETTAIDFEAGTDVNPSTFNRVNLAYVWFDRVGTWVGTAVGTENRAAMTPLEGGYRYHLDVNNAPGEMDFGGTIRFRAILVNSAGTDVGYSEVVDIQIIGCSTGVTPQVPTRTPTKRVVQPPAPVVTEPPVIIITTEVPPAPPEPPPPPPPPPAPKPGAIAGSVSYDSNGDGKCDAAWTFGGLSVDAGGIKTGVDGGGSYYLGPLDAGSYTVTLNHPGYNAIGSDSVGVTVTSGGTASASFCLASPG